jgi:hypothetical protein
MRIAKMSKSADTREKESLRYTRMSSIALRKIGDELLLMREQHAAVDVHAIYILDEIGAAIWERLDGHTTVREIGRALAAEYQVSEEQATSDALGLIQDLEQAGLVGNSESGGGP